MSDKSLRWFGSRDTLYSVAAFTERDDAECLIVLPDHEMVLDYEAMKHLLRCLRRARDFRAWVRARKLRESSKP